MPIDFHVVDKLVQQLGQELKSITGIQPDISIFFHAGNGDTRSLAHDAMLCGYGPHQVHDHFYYPAKHKHSHISVDSKDRVVRIVVLQRSRNA